MSKESDALKSKAKMLAYLGIGYFLSAIYLGLTAFAMHGTMEEIENAIGSLAICGFVGGFGAIAYLAIRKSMLKREEKEIKEPEENKEGNDV